jgi:hypothetical protein
VARLRAGAVLPRARHSPGEQPGRSVGAAQRSARVDGDGHVDTDSLARYSLEARAGRHLLWADTVLGTRRWTWPQRIRVRAGDTVRVNFTSDNADENPFRC